MSDAWPNSREASKSVAFTSSTVAPVEKRRRGGDRKKVHRNEESEGKMLEHGENRNVSYPEKGKADFEKQVAVKWHSFFPTTPIHSATDGMAVSGFMD